MFYRNYNRGFWFATVRHAGGRHFLESGRRKTGRLRLRLTLSNPCPSRRRIQSRLFISRRKDKNNNDITHSLLSIIRTFGIGTSHSHQKSGNVGLNASTFVLKSTKIVLRLTALVLRLTTLVFRLTTLVLKLTTLVFRLTTLVLRLTTLVLRLTTLVLKLRTLVLRLTPLVLKLRTSVFGRKTNGYMASINSVIAWRSSLLSLRNFSID